VCKTVLSVEEIFAVLNMDNVDHSVKQYYLIFMTAVYLTSPFNPTEIGTEDVGHCSSVNYYYYYYYYYYHHHHHHYYYYTTSLM